DVAQHRAVRYGGALTQLRQRPPEPVRVVAEPPAPLERFGEFRRAEPGRQQRLVDSGARVLEGSQRVVTLRRRLVQVRVGLPGPAPVEGEEVRYESAGVLPCGLGRPESPKVLGR